MKLDLNNRHSGETIFLIGTGPQLNNLSDDTISKIENKISIGVNSVFHKINTTYLVSGYIMEILSAKENNSSAQSILLKSHIMHTSDLPNDIIILDKKLFNPSVGLSNILDDEHPFVYTYKNIMLGATHLALIMGAKEVVYIGVEQRNLMHFFDYDDSILTKMIDDLIKISEIESYKNMESDQTICEYIKFLKDKSIDKENKSFYKRSHADRFSRYFKILRGYGIEVYTTKKDSVVFDAGAEFRPIESFLK